MFCGFSWFEAFVLTVGFGWAWEGFCGLFGVPLGECPMMELWLNYYVTPFSV